MGSAKVSTTKSQIIQMADTEKKSLKNILKSIFQKKKKDKKEKNEKKDVPEDLEKDLQKLSIKDEKIVDIKAVANITAAALLEAVKTREVKAEVTDDSEEDESENFAVTVIKEEDKNVIRNDSTSGDSGYSENFTEDKVLEDLSNLKIEDESKEKLKEDGKDKKKKLHTVVVSRGPIRNRIGESSNLHPYARESAYTQINVQTFTGGQVIVNQNLSNAVLDEIDQVLPSNNINANDDLNELLEVAYEYVNEQRDYDTIVFDTEQLISEFNQISDQYTQEQYQNFLPTVPEVQDPIEEFNNRMTLNNFQNEDDPILSGFPTPPRSENVPSPHSLYSPGSYYPSNSEYTLSPERSSPLFNSDHELYQDILPIEELDDVVPRERSYSTSSMNMKQFKDMQKDLVNSFSKKDCCFIERKSCKEMFVDYSKKLSDEARMNLNVEVGLLDLDKAIGVLHHILVSLSKSKDKEEYQLYLFSLICERTLAQKPSLFLEDFGLRLIRFAVLCCYRRPFLTRYLCQCVRVAVTKTNYAVKDNIFHEVDANGDNLLIACARAGDEFAPVLYELVQEQPQLFNKQHTNADGYTALHVACIKHSEDSPRLHTVHVLAKHAHADMWKGDVKGGDSALHLALNSPNCDLQLVMVLFSNVDRKDWKKLAHTKNRSSNTPLDLARTAKNRPKFPQEILNFLKRCR